MKMKEKKKKPQKATNLEKRRKTKRKSRTEGKIQHINKIGNEKAGKNLKKNGKGQYPVTPLEKYNGKEEIYKNVL